MAAKQGIAALTGIRGVAALTVVLSHIFIWAGWKVNGNTPIPGQWAVDVFFVLSGFVISLTYLGRGQISWRSFFSARFARIYPLHIVTALAVGALFTFHVLRGDGADPSVSWLHLLGEVALTTAMPLVGDGLMWNEPSWSISVESWAYILAFPGIAWLHTRTEPKAAAAVAMVLLVALAAILMLRDAEAQAQVKTGGAALGRAVIEFAAGWSAYRLLGSIVIPAKLTDGLAVVLPLVLVGYRIDTGKDAWFLVPLFPIFILGLTNNASVAARLVSTASMVFLGEISYSIYLNHAVLRYVIGPVVEKLDLQHSLAFWIIGFIPLVLIISTATYFLFEKPARDLLRKWLDRRVPATITAF